MNIFDLSGKHKLIIQIFYFERSNITARYSLSVIFFNKWKRKRSYFFSYLSELKEVKQFVFTKEIQFDKPVL
jgi:hypothetical protein